MSRIRVRTWLGEHVDNRTWEFNFRPDFRVAEVKEFLNDRRYPARPIELDLYWPGGAPLQDYRPISSYVIPTGATLQCTRKGSLDPSRSSTSADRREKIVVRTWREHKIVEVGTSGSVGEAKNLAAAAGVPLEHQTIFIIDTRSLYRD